MKKLKWLDATSIFLGYAGSLHTCLWALRSPTVQIFGCCPESVTLSTKTISTIFLHTPIVQELYIICYGTTVSHWHRRLRCHLKLVQIIKNDTKGLSAAPFLRDRWKCLSSPGESCPKRPSLSRTLGSAPGRGCDTLQSADPSERTGAWDTAERVYIIKLLEIERPNSMYYDAGKNNTSGVMLNTGASANKKSRIGLIDAVAPYLGTWPVHRSLMNYFW